MTIVVTGAGGLTGGEIARRLVSQGKRVIAVSRRDARIEGTTSAIGDAGDPAFIAEQLIGADAIVHVAGILEGPRLARAAGLAAVPRLVVVSSAGATGRRTTRIGRSSAAKTARSSARSVIGSAPPASIGPWRPVARRATVAAARSS